MINETHRKIQVNNATLCSIEKFVFHSFNKSFSPRTYSRWAGNDFTASVSYSFSVMTPSGPRQRRLRQGQDASAAMPVQRSSPEARVPKTSRRRARQDPAEFIRPPNEPPLGNTMKLAPKRPERNCRGSDPQANGTAAAGLFRYPTNFSSPNYASAETISFLSSQISQRQFSFLSYPLMHAATNFLLCPQS